MSAPVRVKIEEGEDGWVLTHWHRPAGVRYQIRQRIPTHTRDRAVAERMRLALETSLARERFRRRYPNPLGR